MRGGTQNYLYETFLFFHSNEGNFPYKVQNICAVHFYLSSKMCDTRIPREYKVKKMWIFSNCCFQRVAKETNVAAHVLAKWTLLKNSFGSFWCGVEASLLKGCEFFQDYSLNCWNLLLVVNNERFKVFFFFFFFFINFFLRKSNITYKDTS